MAPIWEKLSKNMGATVHFILINADENKSLAKELKVASLPVVTLYKDGVEIKRVDGFQDEAVLKKMIEEGKH